MKCRRCNSTIFSPDTCSLCGEPHGYITYQPTAVPGVQQRRMSAPNHTRKGIPVSKGTPHFVEATALLRDIQKFCGRYSFPTSAFGRRFFNDGNLVNRLQNGATPRLRTVEGIRQAMRDYENNVDRQYSADAA